MIATVEIDTPSVAAVLGILGVFATLIVNGRRAERQRRRELYARAVESLLAYGEMPFRIRRRRSEQEQRSSERVRLSDEFSMVQAELAACELMIRSTGPVDVADAFERATIEARRAAGGAAKAAWKSEPVSADDEMDMPEIHVALDDFRKRLDEFQQTAIEANRGLFL